MRDIGSLARRHSWRKWWRNRRRGGVQTAGLLLLRFRISQSSDREIPARRQLRTRMRHAYVASTAVGCSFGCGRERRLMRRVRTPGIAFERRRRIGDRCSGCRHAGRPGGVDCCCLLVDVAEGVVAAGDVHTAAD